MDRTESIIAGILASLPGVIVLSLFWYLPVIAIPAVVYLVAIVLAAGSSFVNAYPKSG